MIIRFLQRGRYVIAERDRHIRSGADDPPEPGHGAIASSTSAISSSLALAASARPALHSKQTAGDPMATNTPTCSSAAVLGSRADAAAKATPETGLVFDEAFVDQRQPAQRLLESHRLARISPPAAEHHCTSGRDEFRPPDGVKKGTVSLPGAPARGTG